MFPHKKNVEVEVDKIMKEIDVNNSGEMDFTEFIIAVSDSENLLSK